MQSRTIGNVICVEFVDLKLARYIDGISIHDEAHFTSLKSQDNIITKPCIEIMIVSSSDFICLCYNVSLIPMCISDIYMH